MLGCVSKNTTDPLSLRFPPAQHKRVQAAADQLGLPKHSFCQAAIMAVVEAVEEAGGKAVLPLEFTAKYVPTKKVSRKKKALTKS
jgi:hypothetical protein